MNILDIAIAKKLAGGGGGSGTDNYNDLSNLPKINDTTLSGNKSSSALGLQSEINSDSKLASDLVDDTNQDNKFVTSTEKNTWNAKQNAIDNSHKLSSDLVDDTNHTNKFVTSTEKNTWNAKQNAIDSDHKLSSDLVDDANKTNKFVTSTEKNTWNAKQNAIDADHKLSSSLVSFTTAEAAALASGIDSSKVAQISTNQTNILYGLNIGVKNLLASLLRVGTIGSSGSTITFALQGDGSIVLNGSTTSSVAIFVITEAGRWASSNINGVDEYFENISYKIALFDGGNASGSGVYLDIYHSGWADRATCGVGGNTTFVNPYILRLCVPENKTLNNVRVKPMVCTLDAWNQSSDYQPPALPNYDLTRLESEDRAALIEEIDSGAKNKLKYDLTSLKSINTYGSWDGNVYTYNGMTFTIGNDNSVTIKGTANTITEFNILSRISSGFTLPTGNYVIYGNFTTKAGFDMAVNRTVSGSSKRYATDNGAGAAFTVTDASAATGVWLEIGQGTEFGSSGYKVYPMVCTKAAFGVSPKFVPYRVPINGVFWAEKYEARSTTLVSTGIKFTASKQTIYRITATAQYGNSKPTQLVIKKKLIPSESEGNFVVVSSDTNSQSLTATGIMTLGVGGYFEVYAAYDGTTSNRVYAIVEEVVL